MLHDVGQLGDGQVGDGGRGWLGGHDGLGGLGGDVRQGGRARCGEVSKWAARAFGRQ